MGLKRSQRIRLKFMDAMFNEYHQLSRVMLVDIFDISEITATRDFKAYSEFQRGIFYDRSAKIFKTTEYFKIIPGFWPNDTPEEFLKAISLVYEAEFGHVQVTTFGVKRK